MKTKLYVITKTLLMLSFMVNLTSALSAVPTMEGLFRNGINKDISAELVILKLKIDEQNNDSLMEKIKLEGNEDKLKELLEREKMETKYIELIFSIDGENRYRLIQNEYASQSFVSKDLIRTELFTNIRNSIRASKQSEKHLLYSTLLMFVLNDSRSLVDFAKHYNSDFELNKEMMNTEKVGLLRKYQKYLTVIKEDKEMGDALESPLSPSDEEKRLQVQSVKKARMYTPSQKVKLVRENGVFFWVVDLENFTARFFNNSHMLDFLKMKVGEASLELKCSEYILYDGRHTLPKYFILKDLKDRLFKISMVKLKHYNKSSQKLGDRYKVFKEKISQNVGLGAQVKPLESDIIF